MEGERNCFIYEVEPELGSLIVASGAIYEELIDAVEMFLEFQKKRLGLITKTESMKPRHAAALALIWCCLMSPSRTRAQPTLSIWPALSGSEIDEWANNLRPYKVTSVGITCNKGDEAIAHAIGKAMKQAGWPAPTIYVPEGPVGTGIADSTRSAQAASALQALFEKRFGLRVDIREYAAHDGFIALYIGIPAPQAKAKVK